MSRVTDIISGSPSLCRERRAWAAEQASARGRETGEPAAASSATHRRASLGETARTGAAQQATLVAPSAAPLRMEDEVEDNFRDFVGASERRHQDIMRKVDEIDERRKPPPRRDRKSPPWFDDMPLFNFVDNLEAFVARSGTFSVFSERSSTALWSCLQFLGIFYAAGKISASDGLRAWQTRAAAAAMMATKMIDVELPCMADTSQDAAALIGEGGFVHRTRATRSSRRPPPPPRDVDVRRAEFELLSCSGGRLLFHAPADLVAFEGRSRGERDLFAILLHLLPLHARLMRLPPHFIASAAAGVAADVYEVGARTRAIDLMAAPYARPLSFTTEEDIPGGVMTPEAYKSLFKTCARVTRRCVRSNSPMIQALPRTQRRVLGAWVLRRLERRERRQAEKKAGLGPANPIVLDE